ncbi:hypothetical protein FQR65_LT03219 [Abscondita terminalis]|nr:hypothetical protein FQR65_LT03219 [Abscondita terminalis]
MEKMSEIYTSTETSTYNSTRDSTVFLQAESSLNIKVPESIKNLLIINGYQDASVIANIDDVIISEIESFARNDLEHIIDQNEYDKYYGVFSKNPKMFKFVSGHRQIIKMLSKHFRETLKKQRFEGQKNKHGSKNGRNHCIPVQIDSDSQYSATSPQNLNNGSSERLSPINLTKENAKILDVMKNWAKNKVESDQHLWESLSLNFNNITVNTRVSDSNSRTELYCIITCFCGSSYKLPKVSRKNNSTSQRWIYSNFQTHLLEKHINYKNKLSTKNSSILSFLKQNREQNQNPCQNLKSKAKINIIQDITISRKTSGPDSEAVESDNVVNSCHSNHAESLLSLPLNNVSENTSDKSPLNSKKWKTLRYQRSERSKRARENSIAYQNEGQTLVTDYFQFINQICESITPDMTDIMVKKFKITRQLNDTQNEICYETFEDKKGRLSVFLRKLFTNALQNLEYTNNNNCFDEFTKKVAVYLFYTAGRLAYETLYSNLKNSLPSISTLNRYIENNRTRLEEDILTWKWYHMNLEESNNCYFQDFVHILTKFRVRLLNDNVTLTIGDAVATSAHIAEIINTISKDKHLLTMSDLKGEDKMNFSSAEKMCSTKVIELLNNVPHSQGTILYLTIMNYILSASLNDTMALDERVYRYWFAVFFLRIWRSSIKTNQKLSLKENFLSTNSYVCVELNAHTLIKIILLFKSKFIENIDTDMLYLPNMSSQPCEKLFRTARSMTSTYSTMINFSIKDLSYRIGRIHTINNIISDMNAEFSFPREEKKGIVKQNLLKYSLTYEEIGRIDIESTVQRALNDVRKHVEKIEILKDEIDYMNLDLQLIIHGNEETKEFHDIEIDENITKELGDDRVESDDYAIEEIRNETIIEDSEERSLDLKDYSQNVKDISQDSIYVKIDLKDKIAIIKKSSLCWLLNESNGRVSNDRLRRFIISGSTDRTNNSKRTKPQTKTRSKKNKTVERNSESETNISDTDEDEDVSNENFEEESQMEDGENYAEDVNSKDNLNDNSLSKLRYTEKVLEIDISLEKYYAICYDTQWYIGRIIAYAGFEQYNIKFLKSELEKFVWPKPDDMDIVLKKYVFYGPIELIGTGPFELKRYDYMNIVKKFKLIKKTKS